MELGGWAYAAVFVVTAGLTLVLTPLAVRVALRTDVVDRPSEIKAQASPVPYLGGAAILLSFSLVVLGAAIVHRPTTGLDELAIILGLAAALAVMGLVDDLKGLSPWFRLALEIGAGVAIWASPAGASVFDNDLLDLAATVVWIVGVTNAFNLLDNMDGLSAGVAGIAALSLFAMAVDNGQFLVATLAIALVGCAAGFLRSNFHPARIYMGDAGSLFLGFLLAVLALKLDFVDPPRIVALGVPVVLLGVPIFDTVLVTCTRLRHGRSPLSGGRDHTSHRLVFLGIPVPVTVGMIYGCAASLGLVAVVLSRVDRTSGLLLLGWMVAVGLVLGVLLAAVPVYESSTRRRMMLQEVQAHEPDVLVAPAEQEDGAEARIPVAGPWVTEREVAYVSDAARTSWYGGAGSWVARFEERFRAHTGRAEAIALPSCTSGIHLALAGLGIGPGDEVVVPDITWIATSAPVSYVGADVVFADFDPRTWGLSVEAVEAVLTPRTKAVVVVDLYGCMPDLVGLEQLCAARGIALVEDAAQAIGATHAGRPSGSFGAASIFSFHGTKTMTTGEGGMLLTDDADLARRMRFLRDHGRQAGDSSFRNEEVAFKYRMSDLQAAFGVAQLERLDELVAQKVQVFDWYVERLSGLEAVSLNPSGTDGVNVPWMSTIVLDPSYGLPKEDVRRALDRRGIDSRPFFTPLSALAAYAGTAAADAAQARNAAAYRISPFGVNLPSALALQERDVERVCEALTDLLRRGPAER